MYLLALLACVHVAASQKLDQPYCGRLYSRLCLGKGEHVACQFPVAGPGKDCQNYTKIPFTPDLRTYITNFINKRRQRIAAGQEKVRDDKLIPQPSIMMHVEWDTELAMLAQRLADQCYFVHDECRATELYPYAGQTVGEVRWRHHSSSDELSAKRGIRHVFDAWWSERKRVEPFQLVQQFRITDKALNWGHFSQLAVWTLRAVGCGAVRHGEDYPRLLLVCDFSHTNMLGENTLNHGDLERCPARTRRKVHKKFPLLCAVVKNKKVKQSHSQTTDSFGNDYEEDMDNSEIWNAPEQTELRDPKKWGHWANRLKASEDVNPKHGLHSKDDDHSDEDYEEDYVFTSSTPPTPTTENEKIKFKPQQPWTAVTTRTLTTKMSTTGKKILIDLEEYKRLSGQQQLLIKKNELRGFTASMPVTTPSPIKMEEYRVQKQERFMQYNNRMGTTDTAPISGNDELLFNPRYRWKPKRHRPERPGAAALLRPNPTVKPVEKIPVVLPPRVSLKMDKDVVDQLYADTGFNPSWKTKNNKTLRIINNRQYYTLFIRPDSSNFYLSIKKTAQHKSVETRYPKIPSVYFREYGTMM